MEIRRGAADGLPWARLVAPDPTSVWPRIAPIDEVRVPPGDLTLLVAGPRSPASVVLHSLDVDESEHEPWSTVVGQPESDERGGEPPHVQALAQLEAELASARTPSARRRLRGEIKALRRNPWRAMTLPAPADE